jgi:hypothetical protein
MAENAIHLQVPPEAVFAVLRDPRRYPDWVVGAKRIRGFDHDWPEPGSEFHHAVGAGPAEVKDKTAVVSADEPVISPGTPGDGELLLRARAMPLGVAMVRIRVSEETGGEQKGSRVVMEEWPSEGLGARLNNPLLDAAVHLRNAISLRRLRNLVESGGGR